MFFYVFFLFFKYYMKYLYVNKREKLNADFLHLMHCVFILALYCSTKQQNWWMDTEIH